jgi:hypothetical protein
MKEHKRISMHRRRIQPKEVMEIQKKIVEKKINKRVEKKRSDESQRGAEMILNKPRRGGVVFLNRDIQ